MIPHLKGQHQTELPQRLRHKLSLNMLTSERKGLKTVQFIKKSIYFYFHNASFSVTTRRINCANFVASFSLYPRMKIPGRFCQGNLLVLVCCYLTFGKQILDLTHEKTDIIHIYIYIYVSVVHMYFLNSNRSRGETENDNEITKKCVMEIKLLRGSRMFFLY